MYYKTDDISVGFFISCGVKQQLGTSTESYLYSNSSIPLLQFNVLGCLCKSKHFQRIYYIFHSSIEAYYFSVWEFSKLLTLTFYMLVYPPNYRCVSVSYN